MTTTGCELTKQWYTTPKGFSQAEEARISVQHNSYYKNVTPNTANNIRLGRVEDMEQRKKFMSSTKT